jgi:hypothetical protein
MPVFFIYETLLREASDRLAKFRDHLDQTNYILVKRFEIGSWNPVLFVVRSADDMCFIPAYKTSANLELSYIP